MYRRILLIFCLAISISLIAGCDSASVSGTSPATATNQADKTGEPSGNPGGIAASEHTKVTVYYPTKDAMWLMPEVREIAKTDHPIRAAMEQLLTDPKHAALIRVIPRDVKLLDVVVKDHVAYVNFDGHLTRGSGGSAAEMMLVGSIVDTLTEFPDVHKVQLLVEGKRVDTIYGQLDTSEPFGRDETIIKK